MLSFFYFSMKLYFLNCYDLELLCATDSQYIWNIKLSSTWFYIFEYKFSSDGLFPKNIILQIMQHKMCLLILRFLHIFKYINLFCTFLDEFSIFFYDVWTSIWEIIRDVVCACFRSIYELYIIIIIYLRNCTQTFDKIGDGYFDVTSSKLFFIGIRFSVCL